MPQAVATQVDSVGDILTNALPNVLPIVINGLMQGNGIDFTLCLGTCREVLSNNGHNNVSDVDIIQALI